MSNSNYYNIPNFGSFGLAGFPFDDLLASLSPISPSTSYSPDLAEPAPFIQDNEVRSCLDATLESIDWDAFVLPSPSPSISDFAFTSSFPASFADLPVPLSPIPPLSPSSMVPLSVNPFLSPETVTSSQFDFSSPSSSSHATLTDSPPPVTGVRKLFTSDDSDDEDRPSKRVRTDDAPTHFVFLTTPQPANASASTSTSRLPLNTPTQARCRCKFARGNQKPARHWRTACPYNPAKESNRYPCEIEGCTMSFSRKDNRTRHVEKYH